MSRKWITVLVCALSAAAGAHATNWITVWEATGTYNLLQDPWRTVEITSDGVFKIQATGDHDGLGEIWSITVAYYVTGTVEVSILRDPNEGGYWGAYDVRVLNLSGNATTVIAECRVAHDLATDDNVVAGTLGTTTVGNAIGHDIVVSGLEGDLYCTSMRSLYVNAGTRAPPPSILVGGAWGYEPNDPQEPYDDMIVQSLHYLEFCGSVLGHIDVSGDVDWLYWEGDLIGDVHVSGTLHQMGSDNANLLGLLEVGNMGPCDWYGGCKIDGDLAGTLHVLGDRSPGGLVIRNELSGTVRVDGNAAAIVAECMECQKPEMSGKIIVGGDANGTVVVGNTNVPVLAALTGSIEVGTLNARILVTGDLGDPDDPNDLTFKGHIAVNGSFEGQVGNPVWITVGGDIVGATSFIAVDYDATGDDWLYVDDEVGAIVKVEHGDPENPTIYRGSTPADFVWEISECKGDLDGDGTVGFPDINPFILALTNPVGYSQYFPGLGCTSDPNDPNCVVGSRIWHGDVNCDGSLDFLDINPFVALMSDPCCMSSTCDPCPGGDAPGAGLPAPEDLAKELAANVWPELYDDLVATVGANIDLQADDESRAYWEAVYAALTE